LHGGVALALAAVVVGCRVRRHRVVRTIATSVIAVMVLLMAAMMPVATHRCWW